ncbi:SGNH/GDSL hydrolase family protein [Metabacillus iocasae]|uniref:Lysophospholipase L1-like esterase n=1 Tax=Priestia iocasae TaxID=2291674 RepID=A0ABS2QSX7_9BACI|nr:GDSL-type esterase/lipase family protein [Metabacillus iocasae]MBM7702561.1 lysophospholipase L1-like esterase [Metabacillus iocasae]
MKWNQGILLLICCMSLFIDTATSRAEAPNKLTYIALGDSLSAGIGASEVDYLRTPAFVPKFVTHLRKTNDVYVENHSVPGLTTSGLYSFLTQNQGIQTKLKNANIISISIGGNDFLREIRSSEQVDEDNFKARAQTIYEDVAAIVNYVESLNNDATILLFGLYSPYGDTHEYQEVSQLILKDYHLLLQTLQSERVIVIDPHAPFIGKEVQLTHIEDNDIHPNDEGYDILANLLIKAYEKEAGR